MQLTEKQRDSARRRLLEYREITEAGCWEWTKSKKRLGYGCIKISMRKSATAHRVSYAVFTGTELDEDTVVCHRCDNPACFNPDHLFHGTHADNVRDRVAKGRSATGINNGRSKLTPEKVYEILDALDEGVGVEQIARYYGVDGGVIRDIRIGKTWKECTRERAAGRARTDEPLVYETSATTN
jgi:hypothetical protein